MIRSPIRSYLTLRGLIRLAHTINGDNVEESARLCIQSCERARSRSDMDPACTEGCPAIIRASSQFIVRWMVGRSRRLPSYSIRWNISSCLLPHLVCDVWPQFCPRLPCRSALAPRTLRHHLLLMYLVAVGVGGACASHTFIHTLDYMNSISASVPVPSILNFPIPSPALETAAMSLLAIIGFQLSGGRFRMLAPAGLSNQQFRSDEIRVFIVFMPTDLCRVGAFAVESLSASESYAHATQRRLLQQIGRRYGCHHCGARQGALFSRNIEFIGDHQPPLKYVGARLQRFYPHCPKCSGLQGASVRSNKDVLVSFIASMSCCLSAISD